MENAGEKQKVFPCRYCQRSFRSSKTMMAHMVLKKAELPCRYCSTMFTTSCAQLYHAEVCPSRVQATTIEASEPSITEAVTLGGTSRNGGTPKKESGMRSPVWLRFTGESPVKVRDSPQKNGTPDSKRIKTESPSPQKRSSPSVVPNPPQLPPTQPEVIQVIDEEAFSKESFEEKENKLAQILLAGNDEETYCPVCDCHFSHIERHGRSHGMAFLKFCILRQEKMAAAAITLTRC